MAPFIFSRSRVIPASQAHQIRPLEWDAGTGGLQFQFDESETLECQKPLSGPD